MAWVAHVLDSAREQPSREKFKTSSLSDDFIRKLTKLSVRDDGPKRALAAVRGIGISVVIESGLPGMSVDGASLHTTSAGPVLALTLRYDRLDNFWFTLLHELGHIALHLSDPSDDVFIDSLEDSASDEQEVEAEANAFAKDGLIPRDLWLRSDAYRLGSEGSVLELAKQLGVHPAIVAGRIRHERREFRNLHRPCGRGQRSRCHLRGRMTVYSPILEKQAKRDAGAKASIRFHPVACHAGDRCCGADQSRGSSQGAEVRRTQHRTD